MQPSTESLRKLTPTCVGVAFRASAPAGPHVGREALSVLSRCEFGGRGALVRISKQESRSRRGPAQPTKNRVTLALLESIKIPALVIAGDADLYAPPAVMRRIADRIKGAQFVVFPDAVHSVWWEARDKFNRTVLTFVAKH